jgi:predicted Rossmann fold nucleotide-binding protein DprA/Smf involved in DNA uptake
MSSGMSLVSGGAVGCDQIAAQAALLTGPGARVVEILPFGLECPGGGADARPGITRVSVCEPGARFATGQAMERNLLIYALSSATGVVGPRLRQGGTWSGAAEALRRRVGPVLVAGDDAPAVSALRAMGALDLVSFVDVAAALERDDLCGEPSLFRPVDALLERRAGYLVA